MGEEVGIGIASLGRGGLARLGGLGVVVDDGCVKHGGLVGRLWVGHLRVVDVGSGRHGEDIARSP